MPSLATLTYEAPLFILKLHNADNRFTNAFMDELNKILDAIEQRVRKDNLIECALVTTIDPKDKIWSNGLSFEDMRDGAAYFSKYQLLMNRFLTLPMPTVAALSGHAFAGGCMFAFVHDYRIMRSDRGFICMNEVDLKAALSPGMTAIIRSRISQPNVLRQMLLEGHRFSAEEGKKYGFVDEAVAGPEEVIRVAKELAKKWAPKASWAYMALKTESVRDVSRLLQSNDMGFVAAIIKQGAKL
ncbi:hypothetical protein HDV05_000780 [Chytridiales sp. JEL 0842]|nr:hypothetical protein HDV05_000780 [Chytridiales sp. JEL 0842]